MEVATINKNKQKFTFQRNVAIVGVILFIGKLIAWHLTNSDAVFSDAMESIVNIISAFMGLYSLYLAAQPKDENHPYGHGKIEHLSVGFEGGLIWMAGVYIFYTALQALLHPHALARPDGHYRRRDAAGCVCSKPVASNVAGASPALPKVISSS